MTLMTSVLYQEPLAWGGRGGGGKFSQTRTDQENKNNYFTRGAKFSLVFRCLKRLTTFLWKAVLKLISYLCHSVLVTIVIYK